MTTPNSDQAAGVRRAAAFFLHHGNRDGEGVQAVLSELSADPMETYHFLMGIGHLLEVLLPILFSSAGQWLVRQTIADLAGIESGEVS